MKTEARPRHAILAAIFDTTKGWPFSPDEVPLTYGEAPDGNPFVVVNVDGREIVVAEKTQWADGANEGPSPHRIIAFLAFSGIAVSDTKVLLQENLGTHGLPSWGIDDDGDLTLSASVLVGASIPLEITRKQLLVGLGLIAETVDKILDAVNQSAPEGGEKPAADDVPKSGAVTKRLLAYL